MPPVYPDKVSEKCRSPKFTEKVIYADAEGIAVAIECGTFVRFCINITEGNIAAVSFASNGCGYSVAAAEVLAEYLHGKRLVELHGLNTDELMSVIVSETAALPSERTHCAATVVDAVRETFAEYRRSRIEEFRGERALICTCFGVSEDAIDNIIHEHAGVTIDEIGRITNAGLGCGSCRMLIQEMIDSAAGS